MSGRRCVSAGDIGGTQGSAAHVQCSVQTHSAHQLYAYMIVVLHPRKTSESIEGCGCYWTTHDRPLPCKYRACTAVPPQMYEIHCNSYFPRTVLPTSESSRKGRIASVPSQPHSCPRRNEGRRHGSAEDRHNAQKPGCCRDHSGGAYSRIAVRHHDYIAVRYSLGLFSHPSSVICRSWRSKIGVAVTTAATTMYPRNC